jgi:hypothetical protein
MADSLFDPDLIAEAEAGFQEFARRFGELAGEPVDPVDSIIRFLRTIPAEDMRKKEELAKFFRSDAGSKYSAEDRKAAYDRLLGAEINRRMRG